MMTIMPHITDPERMVAAITPNVVSKVNSNILRIQSSINSGKLRLVM